MGLSLRIDANIPKNKSYELAQKFIKWRKIDRRKKVTAQRYNLTLTDIKKIKEFQNSCCAICGDILVAGKATHIDHCHTIGNVRGILCRGCNNGLGHFKENIETLKNAIIYLEKPPTAYLTLEGLQELIRRPWVRLNS